MKIIALFVFVAFFSVNSLSATKCGKVIAKGDVKKSLAKKLIGLNYDHVFLDSPDNLDYALYHYPYLKLPKATKKQPHKKSLNIAKINFMQHNCRWKSSSRNGDYGVLQNAIDLKKGKLSLDDIPPITVWQDETGKIWTLNHRRLAAFVLSGLVNKVPVIWASDKLIRSSSTKDKYYPQNKGRTIDIMFVDEGFAIQITNKDT